MFKAACKITGYTLAYLPEAILYVGAPLLFLAMLVHSLVTATWADVGAGLLYGGSVVAILLIGSCLFAGISKLGFWIARFGEVNSDE